MPDHTAASHSKEPKPRGNANLALYRPVQTLSAAAALLGDCGCCRVVGNRGLVYVRARPVVLGPPCLFAALASKAPTQSVRGHWFHPPSCIGTLRLGCGECD